jgi:uncharacterized GH25 family protein
MRKYQRPKVKEDLNKKIVESKHDIHPTDLYVQQKVSEVCELAVVKKHTPVFVLTEDIDENTNCDMDSLKRIRMN